MLSHLRLPALAPVLALALALPLAGCAADADDDQESSGSSSAVEIQNCGHTVTVEAPPERVVLVNNDPVANLEALGAIDRVVAITADLQEGLYDDATYDALGSLDLLSTETNATGGSVVSQEALLGAEPDLVIAPENAVDRAALERAGIPLYVPTAYCNDPSPELSETATFDRVWTEVRDLGTILGESERADEVVADGEAELAAETAPDAGTAVALYVSSGGSVLSPYGGPSMVTPVFEAAGLTNVYAESDERVFDVNVEDVLSRDPGTIVLLYSGGDPQETLDAFASAPGVDDLAAVRDGRVVALPFSYTDPPSVLSLQGPAQLRELLAGLG
ncbi:ABC transporter substrate-binding protein [Nocardioides lijunqiniae]|uniref:ABC transporter substrate-binding protein n=1 Tax=Nocardioides lijunqiniae TaxID=2760832 RepID=UPI001877ED8A